MKNQKNVYTLKSRKSVAEFFKTFISILLTCLLGVGFGVFSYSVAKPVSDFIKEDRHTIIAESSAEESSNVEKVSETQEETVVSNIPKSVHTYTLSDNDLKSTKSLEAALSAEKLKMYNTVAVPLKLKGGKLNYSTKNNVVWYKEILNAGMTLDYIVSAIEKAGKKPAAYMDVLNDNIYPKVYNEAGYKNEVDGSMWLDDTEENNGKPWLSPYSDTTKTYIQELSEEIASAGFEYIVAGGINYPNFTEDDERAIGSKVSSNDRRLELVAIANLMNSAISENESTMLLEISAYDYFTEKSEVYQPIILDPKLTVLDIDASKFYSVFSYVGGQVDFTGMPISDKILKICDIFKTSIGQDFIPCIVKEGMSDKQLQETITALMGAGYQTYIVK